MSFRNTFALQNPIIKAQKFTDEFDFFGSITHSVRKIPFCMAPRCGATNFQNIYIYTYMQYLDIAKFPPFKASKNTHRKTDVSLPQQYVQCTSINSSRVNLRGFSYQKPCRTEPHPGIAYDVFQLGTPALESAKTKRWLPFLLIPSYSWVDLPYCYIQIYIYMYIRLYVNT